MAKIFREQLRWTHFVMFGIDEDGTQHVVTHGKTESDANECATFGNKLKKEIRWPADLCRSKPLERVCKNCSYSKSHRCLDSHYYVCYLERKTIEVDRDRRACRDFEPRV
jgi:hypothetical protein